MAAGKQLVAAAPLVIVKDVVGVDHYLYEGQPLTVEIPGERRKQLLAEGKLAEAAPLVQAIVADSIAAGEVQVERPAKSATVAVWRSYAKTVGLADEDIDGLKKNELVDAVTAQEESSTQEPSGEGGDGEDGNEDDEDLDIPFES